MKKQNKLINGYSKKDKARVDLLLSTLLNHLKPKKFIIVGGVSTRFNSSRVGIKFPIRPLNDIDIIIESREVILPSITRNFLVYHYHPNPSHNGSFYIALIFPNTKTKIDFFDYSNKPEKIYRIKYNEHLVQIQSAEDQLVNTVNQIQRISNDDKVDPKQFLDLEFLIKSSNLEKATSIWEIKHRAKYGKGLKDAIQKAKKNANDHPEWLQVKPERKSEPYTCRDCVVTKDFPIAPMETIYKLMGYTK